MSKELSCSKSKDKPVLVYLDFYGRVEVCIKGKVYKYNIPYGHQYWVKDNFDRTPWKVINYLKRYEVKNG